MTEKNDEPTIEEQLKDTLEVLTRLGAEPMIPATVLQVNGDRTLIARGSDIVEVATPSKFTVKTGDSVMLLAQTGGIFKLTERPFALPQVVLERMIDERLMEVSHQGSKRVVLRGAIPEDTKPGSMLQMDPGGVIGLALVPDQKRRNEYGAEGSDVSWNDIAGQVEAKATLRECIEGPLAHPELYKHYGKKATKGVLLSGPPGCGKTMLGKAAATAVAALHDSPAASGFIYVKAPEILDPYVGVAEANVRQLFSRAREHFEKHGVPAVVFIDEADAVLGVRGAHHSHMEKTIVPMFLTEMDGMDASGAMVILATNRPDQLDPAVTREGRIDHKIQVARPNVQDTFELFKLYLAKLPITDDIEAAAAYATEAVYDGALHLYDLETERGEVMKFLFRHLLSGSMVANIVDQAGTLALRRDLANETVTGVGTDDVIEAVSRVFETNRHTNHDDAIKEFAGGSKIANVRKCHVPAAQVN